MKSIWYNRKEGAPGAMLGELWLKQRVRSALCNGVLHGRRQVGLPAGCCSEWDGGSAGLGVRLGCAERLLLYRETL